MTDATSGAAPDRARASELSGIGRFLKATEIDTRMLGMVGALLIIWIGLQLVSSLRIGVNPFEFDSRTFLAARNLWNLSVQTSSVAIMATGMVLVIVARNIDLSVGSVRRPDRHDHGVSPRCEFLVRFVGLELGNPWIWVLALAIGLAIGIMHRRVPGFHHCLYGCAGLYRDAGRLAGLARRRVVGHQRARRSRRWTTLSG